jgi:signal transduction histidine kinase
VEPGVLYTFRLFVTVQLCLTLLGLVGHWLLSFRAGSEIITLTTFSVIELAVLLAYLSIPGLQRLLRSAYLPVAIIMATVGPVLDPYLQFHMVTRPAPPVLTELILWRQIILLMTPLIITSWQYSFRQMVVFCGLTAAINLGMLGWLVGIDEMIERSLMGTVLTEAVVFFLVGHMILNLMQVQRRQRKRLAEYASTLEQLTISRERNRLAREMHDVLAHTLSGVAVELEGARTMLRRDPDQSETLLNHSLDAVREGLGETRRALQELRARPLEDLGLALALQSLADGFNGRDDLRIEVTVDSDLGVYPVDVQQCIYRVAQEALANVASHAQARTARLSLHREDDTLRLVVEDDGSGFDPAAASGDMRFGLLGMRERAEMVGGKLSIDSAPGKGTQVTLLMRVANVEPA